MFAKQGLGVMQIIQHRFPRERWLVIANTSENAFMPPPMPIPVIDKWQYCLSSLGCCVIQHAHRGLDCGVARRLGERIMELNVKRVKHHGIPAAFRQPIQRGLQTFNVGSRGALGRQRSRCGFDDFPQFVDFKVLYFIEQDHPLEVLIEHSAQRRLNISSVSRSGLDEAKIHQTLERFTQRAPADAQHLGEIGLRWQSISRLQIAAAHKLLDPVSDHIHYSLAMNRLHLVGGDCDIAV